MARGGVLEQRAKARLDYCRLITNYAIFCCFFPPQKASPGKASYLSGKPRVLHTVWRSHGLIKCLRFLVSG